ncbi:hypothetical protein HZY83_07410 [Gemella sp. GH3]|uniref:hypothetical protein n=1 Tax=unclassified Gemella TaxID=2624949 RepID=UPI0015D01B5A|nr:MULTISPECIES: hypothetical protein [unclassified Gemella]MBF0714501.1 hypothetical protein [Gemella sp. GH3.1]NYS51453.1 hypothetical protein [Gemella sp. GH3]
MESMIIPKKETLIYFDKVDSWILSEEITDNGIILVFKKDTPKEISTLLDIIKDKLDFKIKDYSISN